MHRMWILGALALVTVVTACGTGNTTTEVKTVTAPSGQAAPSATTGPSGTSAPSADGTTAPSAPGASSATPATPAAPLPGGRAAVDGRYLMKVRATSVEKLIADATEGDESTWPISTVCTGATCRLDVRRELKSGAFESVTLDEVKDRTYAASSTGKTTGCTFGPPEANTRQRLSIRVSGVKELNGRPTAQRVDAYLTTRAKCSTKLTPGPGLSTVSWRGTRVP